MLDGPDTSSNMEKLEREVHRRAESLVNVSLEKPFTPPLPFFPVLSSDFYFKYIMTKGLINEPIFVVVVSFLVIG